MKNRIIIISLLSLFVFAFGSFLVSGLMDNASGSYDLSYDEKKSSSEDIITSSVDVRKATKRGHRAGSTFSFSTYDRLSSDEMVAVSSSSSFSGLGREGGSFNNMSHSSKIGLSFTSKGGGGSLLAVNGGSSNGAKENNSFGGGSGGGFARPFGAPGFSRGTILIDPMTDPDPSTRIPVGNGVWILVLLAGAYAGKKTIK